MSVSVTPLYTRSYLESLKSMHLTAREVLEKESEAIQILSKNLDGSFNQAIDLILNTKGKIVLSGVGKSGHIAQKIASTFSSTGTPAIFLHPTEAGHGDLGLVQQKEDIFFFFSNSGKTQELEPLVSYANEHHIPILFLTSDPKTDLAKKAQITLVLPNLPEACPLELAPTVSTTMMLALGDAFAVTLLKIKNFQAEDYKKLHPSGALGKKLLSVETIMLSRDALPFFPLDTLFQDALFQMASFQINCAIVELSPEKRAVLSLETLSTQPFPETPLNQLPVHPLLNIPTKTFIKDALNHMNQNKISLLGVKSLDGNLLGFVHRKDCES